MQVKIETSKGEVLCVLPPENASDLTYPKVGMIDLYFQLKEESGIPEEDYVSVGLPDVGFKLIAPLSEVTEEQAKMMVEDLKYGMYDHMTCFKDYVNFGIVTVKEGIKSEGYGFDTAIDSFKSLMQAHKVHPSSIVLFKEK